MEESYEDLLRNFNAGSERAFKKLYDSHFGAACSFVAQYVADTFTVEDIVQETFIHIWEKRGTYTDFVHFKAYLYKSLRNNTLLFLRDSRPSEEPDASVPDDTDNALQAIITEEVHREIIAAIKKLPQERQKIIPSRGREMGLELHPGRYIAHPASGLAPRKRRGFIRAQELL